VAMGWDLPKKCHGNILVNIIQRLGVIGISWEYDWNTMEISQISYSS
jgi:hypothetical protein